MAKQQSRGLMLLAKAVANAITVNLLSFLFVILGGSCSLVRYSKALFIKARPSSSAATESSMKSLMLIV